VGKQHRAVRATTGGMFVVGETLVRYHRPARLDDELLVTARVQESGRASLIIAQQAFLRDGAVLLCEGTIRIGWVEARTLKPARIPPTLLEVLKQ
jgi:acyl-CoA thioester hydrolase